MRPSRVAGASRAGPECEGRRAQGRATQGRGASGASSRHRRRTPAVTSLHHRGASRAGWGCGQSAHGDAARTGGVQGAGWLPFTPKPPPHAAAGPPAPGGREAPPGAGDVGPAARGTARLRHDGEAVDAAAGAPIDLHGDAQLLSAGEAGGARAGVDGGVEQLHTGAGEAFEEDAVAEDERVEPSGAGLASGR